MTAKSMRLIAVVSALSFSALSSAEVSAQCCGNTGYYPSSHSSYYGGAYTSYYGGGYAPNYAGGWYPGYWMDRVRTRLWGSPSTYVAAYSPYTVGYAGYATSYAPSTHSVGYSPCTTCASPCNSCVQQVSLSPVCGCDNCSSGCSSCSASPVVQAGYVQQAQPGCTCSGGAQHAANVVVQAPANGAAPQQVLQAPAVQQPAAPPATGSDQPPGLSPGEGQPQPTFQNQKPVNGSEQGAQPGAPAQPGPGDDINTPPASEDATKENSTYFEAPKLFNPKDRTASRGIAPVRTALYEQPASMHRISAQRTVITQQQAQQDAAGWSSVSN